MTSGTLLIAQVIKSTNFDAKKSMAFVIALKIGSSADIATSNLLANSSFLVMASFSFMNTATIAVIANMIGCFAIKVNVSVSELAPVVASEKAPFITLPKLPVLRPTLSNAAMIELV